MHLYKLSLVTLVLLVRTTQSEIVVGTPSLNSSISRLFEDVVDVVTSCYGARQHGVGLVGNLPDTFIRTLSVQHSIPVTLMCDNRRLPKGDYEFYSHQPRVPVQFRHKLHVFIVKVSSAKEFSNVIRNIRYFIWWNHMASFIILDLSPGCVHYVKYLAFAWNVHILNAKVMCRTTNEKTVIITGNPFTRQAPVAWRRLETFSMGAKLSAVKRPFVTFFREYRGNKAICVDLEFDKSKDLGGFQIFIEGYDESNRTRDSHKYIEANKLFNKHRRILSTIFNAMNGTPEHLVTHKGQQFPGDVRMHPLWMNGQTWSFNLITYPYEQVGYVLVSQFRGHKSQLNKILTVVDFNSRVGIGIVYLITLAFFKFFVHKTLVPAILNIVRITCNTAFTNLPDNNASRTFMTSLLFFVVTIQGIYQGNLASLLTTVIPLRDIETMQDVVDFKYQIYGNSASLRVVDHPELRKRYIPLYGISCTEYAKNDSSAVCLVIGDGIALDKVRKYALHASSKFVTQTYVGFKVPWDSPFEHQINIIIRKLVEADVIIPWKIKCVPTKLTEFQFDKEVQKNVDFKNIELGELTFAFVILGIGLTCAIITFIAEVAIYSYKSRIVNVKVHRLN